MGKKNTNEELGKGLGFLKDMTEESGHLYDALTSIGDQIATAINNAVEGADNLNDAGKAIANTYKRDIVNSIKASARSLEKHIGFAHKIAKGFNVERQIKDAILKNDIKKDYLAMHINKLKEKGLLDLAEEKEGLLETLKLTGEQLEDLEKANTEKQKSVSIYAILGKSLGGMADKLDKTGTLSAILKGNLDKAVTVQRVGQLASIDLVAGLIKGVLQLDKLQTQYNKSFGMTDTQAASVHKRMSQIAQASGRTSMTFIDMHKAIAGIAEATGILATGLRDDVIEEAAELQKLLGLSNKGMAMLAFNAQVTGQGMEAQSESMVRGIQLAEKDLGITIDKRKVMQEVGELSGLIRANFGRNVGLMAEVVSKAKAFGITMQDLASVSSNLLNFQSSIEAELTAELFIGKQLNLEKARLYALTGDYKGLMGEIIGQLGSEYEFLSMNVLAKQKYAAALGMSVDQMSNLIFKETELSVLMEQASARNDQDTLNMLKQRDLSERMADIMTKVQTTFVAIAEGPLGTLAAGIGKMLESADLLLWVLGAVAVIKLGGLITSMYSLATAFGLAGAGAAWMTGLATAGIGLAIAVPIILGTMATMKKSQKEMKVVNFQHGGIVEEETFGRLGEAGSTEAVIPLTEFYRKIDELIEVNINNKPHKQLANWEYRSSW
tara:strand:+ start:449 stop:2446 length:1998 start_codon:yes stop_codon:yes gene_type:complete